MDTVTIGIDVETTHPEPWLGGITEIAAVVEREGGVTYEFHQLVLPHEGAAWHPEARRVNRYSAELWADSGAVEVPQALDRFRQWIDAQRDEGVEIEPLAHGAYFDRHFLEYEMRRAAAVQRLRDCDLRLGHRWACSQVGFRVWRKVMGRPGPCGLRWLGIESGFWTEAEADELHHHPMHDARCSLHGWRWLVQQLKGAA